MRKEHTPLVNLLLTTSLMLTSCSLPARNNSSTSEATPTYPPPQATPTLIYPDTTPTPTPLPTDTPEPIIVNQMTGAIYRSVPNPEGKPGKCVELGRYTDWNKQDVYGAATALGPDPGRYNDYPKFDVYGVGTFTIDSPPDPEQFRLVPPGTIVCED